MRAQLVAFFVLFSTNVLAVSDFQSWTALFVERPLGERWIGFGEIQNRLSENSSKERQLLLRAAAGYRITKTHSVWLGYGWTPTFHPAYLDEHRLWQQSLARYDWEKWALSLRFRLEERWPGGGATAWRWREQIRGAYKFSGHVHAVLWDEFFFNLNRTPNVTVSGFAQNRLFVGPRFVFSEEWALEMGYLNVIQRPSDTYHVAAVSFFYNGQKRAD